MPLLAPVATDIDRIRALQPLGLEANPLEWTARFRTPDGSMVLLPKQAEALATAAQCGGLVADLPVGAGKTLISLLLPVACYRKAPVLLVPASAVKKTQREFAELGRHWQHKAPRIVTYSKLSIDYDDKLLEGCDLIIADEAHHLRNYKAGCTKKVARHMRENPGTIFCALSATLLSKTLLDIGHIYAWALRRNSPLPLNRSELYRWSLALDPPKWGHNTPLRIRGLEAPWVAEKLRTAPGVVSQASAEPPVRLHIETWKPEVPEPVAAALVRLYGAWELPDGTQVDFELDVARHARTLAWGFFYKWDPAPPAHWREARRQWHRALGEKLPYYDTPLLATRALEGHPTLEAWRRVRDDYTIEPKPVWIDRGIIDQIEADERTLIWVYSRALGEALPWPFYRDGRHPEPGPAVLSISSYKQAHNLQAWNRSIVLQPPSLAVEWEQLIGRTYRSGQTRDVTVIIPCHEKYTALALANAQTNSIFISIYRDTMPRIGNEIIRHAVR